MPLLGDRQYRNFSKGLFISVGLQSAPSKPPVSTAGLFSLASAAVNNFSIAAIRDRIQGVKYTALGSQAGTLWNKYELKVTK